MKCKEIVTKLTAFILFEFVAVSLILLGMEARVFPDFSGSILRYTAAEPLAYLFQIMFILFIISPPLIVFMLFLIWKELKAKNKMK